jgi:hypothetical protein
LLITGPQVQFSRWRRWKKRPRYHVSRSIIAVQREFRARFKKTLFLGGASFLTRARNSRSTVIIDLDTSKRSTQKAFSCYDAILETGSVAPQ